MDFWQYGTNIYQNMKWSFGNFGINKKDVVINVWKVWKARRWWWWGAATKANIDNSVGPTQFVLTIVLNEHGTIRWWNLDTSLKSRNSQHLSNSSQIENKFENILTTFEQMNGRGILVLEDHFFESSRS